MNTTTGTAPNELEIRVERIFDAPRTHVDSAWTDPKPIPEWWTTEQRDTTMRYGVEEGAMSGFARVDGLLRRLAAR